MGFLRFLAILFLIYLIYKLFKGILAIFSGWRRKEPESFVSDDKEKKEKIIPKDEGEYVDFEEIE